MVVSHTQDWSHTECAHDIIERNLQLEFSETAVHSKFHEAIINTESLKGLSEVEDRQCASNSCNMIHDLHTAKEFASPSCCCTKTKRSQGVEGFAAARSSITMPRLHAHAEFKYVPGGRCYIEERLGISITGRPQVMKYNDPARAFRLEQRLWKLKAGEHEAFELFYRREFLPVYDELVDSGRPELDDEALVFLLLNALPGSWNGFVAALVASGLDTLPLADVLDRILLVEAAERRMHDAVELVRPGSSLAFESRGRIPSMRASGTVDKRERPRSRAGARVYSTERLGLSVREGAHVTKYDEPARRFRVEQRLRSLTMREGECFQDFFLRRFVPVYEELYDMGRELDEEALVFLVLNGLPGSWRGFVKVVVAAGLDVLPLIEVLVQIEAAEEVGLEMDDAQNIGRVGLERIMVLRSLEASRRVKSRKRHSGCPNCAASHEVVDCLSSAMASNLSILGARAEAAPSRVQTNMSTKTSNGHSNRDPKDDWVMISSLKFEFGGFERSS